MFSFISGSFRRIKKTYTNTMQYNIWHLQHHEVWITAFKNKEKANCINDWSFNPIGPILRLHRTFVAHKDRIMDVIEFSSRPVIATCSLDRKICIWDLYTGCKVGSFKPKHLTGVKSLDYTTHSSSLLISVGYEEVIKVWSTELPIDHAYIGSLKGHKSSVISAKFLKSSPYVVSIDEKLNLRLWDVRKLDCIQSIVQVCKGFTCNGLCTINNEQFILYGNGILSYDTILDKIAKEKAKSKENTYPFKAEINNYIKSLIIATRIDIRFHDLETGQLIKALSRFEHSKQSAELTAFCLSENDRLFYLGDAYGSIGVYNVNNGSLLKSLINTQKKSEIGSLEFVKEDKILLAVTPKMISAYDEINTKVNYRLRTIKGGHKTYSITCMQYSEQLSLIATGDSNGQVNVWDYEKSRIEYICKAHSEEILDLKFIDPYPLLLVSSCDGAISLWGVRGAPKLTRYNCLACFLNVYECSAIPVTSFIIMKGDGYNVSLNFSESKELEDIYRNSLQVNNGVDWRVTNDAINSISFFDLKELQKFMHSEDNTFMVTGDRKGRLRIVSIKPLIEALGIQKVRKYREQHELNPRRKEDIDVSCTIQNNIPK